ncbi:chromosome segregation protein SMC [Methanohalophilus mahii]|uniref:Chromosome partition protein Smc n=1 Tax=Methanohalophilus mahii (strain ATCC 35705 / DSM 5219 / SLP) TaxID=547558 RepID=D5E817_METMS|nr:chromosome segregation protein SMC [Methanohalophilus mahii]ADE37305.1 condensin subunit Smc [Methanohalophilus mahii DSM 5219]
MYIKKIEFMNFKSFGKKVKIPFFDDFTTISGPNGSGKSNIIDGILFVLGLSSSRTLRAEKLTDLIYNGEKSKNPDNAQVTIYFDNKDRELPVDNDEVVISRKVRSTDNGYYSYFYFNGKSVSLGDVHNYLAKARVTPEGYNVVMQGDVTRIITMTAGERRKIIDEIAGVAEFDNKKERALNELEVVRERIERADILIDEVDKQKEKLQGERDQAVKYQSLKEEKMKFEGFVLLSKLKDAKTELEGVGQEYDTQQEKLEKISSELKQKKEVLEQREEELRLLNQRIQKMGEDEQIEVKRRIEEIRGEISGCSDRIDYAGQEIDEIDAARRRFFLEIDESKGKVDDIEEKVGEHNFQKETLQSEISEKRTQRMLLQSRIADVDEKFARTRDELSANKDELEQLKTQKNELMRNEDRLLDSLRRKSADVAEIEDEIRQAKEKAKSSESDTKSVQYDIDKLNEKIEGLTKDLDDLESNRHQIKKVVSDLENDIRRKQQDYAMLEARVRAAEDTSRYSRAVDAVIKEKDKHGLPGIYGTIAELGKVNQKYSTALGIAAGGRMQAVVVDTDEDASRAIAYLKRQRSGRATFLPLNKMEARRPYKNLSDREGVIGYAIDLIDFDPKFEAAFWYVFRDTLVVDTLENARKLMGGLRMVTLEGEIVEKSGAMSGGSQRKSGLSFAASEKDKLVRISEELTKLESRRSNAINKLDTTEGHISSTNKEIQQYENEVSRKQMQFEEIGNRGETLEKLLNSKDEELKQIEEERQQMRTEMNETVEKKEHLEEREQSLQQNILQIEEKLADSEIPELNKQAEDLDEELRRLDGRIRDIDGQINALELDKKYATEKMEQNREQIAQMDEKKRTLKERIEELKNKITSLESELEEKKQREEELTGELRQLQGERENKETAYSTQRDEVDRVKSRYEKAENQKMALEATLDAVKEQIEQLREEVTRRGLEETDEVPGYETVRTRITSIEKAMEALEPVNMRAIDEYEEVEQRIVDLKSRRAILFNEREQILDRIDQYDNLKKETFMETYNGINDAFKEIFNELSDGAGELVLDNEEDPFSGGMTLKAQPRDKTLQRLEAMSGGEKSLTALAFLFAIQQYRPAPFYAFDEIDMFLDGVNAERVARRVKKAAGNAQFIVVSLRKPMIEAAERTIGVTMQQDNITSITGMKIR